MTSPLIQYLPDYYHESRQMNAIMDAAAPDIPDVEGRLLHSLFLSESPDEWLYLWKQELQEEEREALLAKLRSSGTLNRETIDALGLSALETFRLSPDDGYTLSGDDAMFPDGEFFGPLITAIYVNPDQVEVVRKLIQISGFAGFKYWLAVMLKQTVKLDTAKAGTLRSLYPGPDRETKLNYEEVSGYKVSTGLATAIYAGSSKAEAERGAWWSPGVFFTDELYFTEKELRIQQSAVTIAPANP
ncbi:hypothetical protein [Paenibacillus glycanilyticus]|uniref:DUF2313 domain-containing protein n=1 Tax=Paenibacillus glycanilyticus TaxID=126569 RepID=A0ABQ6NIK7_9BACL|nr:hypothetical protein [Paenibacillus glycanilyticus]GMK44032.1 hypothetical protein PghCCS26_11590 [Paenibacillus glycanilyticus]